MKPYDIDQAEADLRAAIADGDQERIETLGGEVDALEGASKATHEATLLAAALWYAERGLHVFPLQPGTKVPFKGSNGCKDATTDPDMIRKWWEGNPNANLAIATGHIVDVVDIDGPTGQKSRVDHWETIFNQIDNDALAKVLTPRAGGMHIYVPATGEGNSTGIVAGVDYRGRGGYAVCPPSSTPQGAYRFLGIPNLAVTTIEHPKAG